MGTENDQSWFSQSVERFEDILFRGARGGPHVIETYLRTRRQILLREMSLVIDKGGEPSHYVRALSIFGCAIEVVNTMLAIGDVNDDVDASAVTSASQ